jgi:hypothetical protein
MSVAQISAHYAEEFIAKHPEHKNAVIGLRDLLLDEVSEGGDEDHELDLFYGACDDLLIEDKD